MEYLRISIKELQETRQQSVLIRPDTEAQKAFDVAQGIDPNTIQYVPEAEYKEVRNAARLQWAQSLSDTQIMPDQNQLQALQGAPSVEEQREKGVTKMIEHLGDTYADDVMGSRELPSAKEMLFDLHKLHQLSDIIADPHFRTLFGSQYNSEAARRAKEEAAAVKLDGDELFEHEHNAARKFGAELRAVPRDILGTVVSIFDPDAGEGMLEEARKIREEAERVAQQLRDRNRERRFLRLYHFPLARLTQMTFRLMWLLKNLPEVAQLMVPDEEQGDFGDVSTALKQLVIALESEPKSEIVDNKKAARKLLSLMVVLRGMLLPLTWVLRSHLWALWIPPQNHAEREAFHMATTELDYATKRAMDLQWESLLHPLTTEMQALGLTLFQSTKQSLQKLQTIYKQKLKNDHFVPREYLEPSLFERTQTIVESKAVEYLLKLFASTSGMDCAGAGGSSETALLGSDGGRSTQWCFAAREKLMRDAKVFLAKNFEPALEREMKKRKAVSAEMIALRTGAGFILDELNQVPAAAAEEMAVSVLHRELDRIARNHGKGTAAVKLVKCEDVDMDGDQGQTEDNCQPIEGADGRVTLVAGSAYSSRWAAAIPGTKVLPLLPEPNSTPAVVSLAANTKIAMCESMEHFSSPMGHGAMSKPRSGLGVRLSNVLAEYVAMAGKGEHFSDRALRGFFTSEFERKVSSDILTPDNVEKFMLDNIHWRDCSDAKTFASDLLRLFFDRALKEKCEARKFDVKEMLQMSSAAKSWVESAGAGGGVIGDGMCGGKAAWMVESISSDKIVKAFSKSIDGVGAAPAGTVAEENSLRSGVYCKFSTLPETASFMERTPQGSTKTWVYVISGDANTPERWSALDARGHAVEFSTEPGPHECVMGSLQAGDYVEVVLPRPDEATQDGDANMETLGDRQRLGRIVERFDEQTDGKGGKRSQHVEYEVKLDSPRGPGGNVFPILPAYALIPAPERDPMDPCNKSENDKTAAAVGADMQAVLSNVNIAQTTVKAKTDICRVPVWQRFFSATREGLLEISTIQDSKRELEEQNIMLVRDEIVAEVDALLAVRPTSDVVSFGADSLVARHKALRKTHLKSREILRSTIFRKKIQNTVAKYKAFLDETFEVTSKDGKIVPEKKAEDAGEGDDPMDEDGGEKALAKQEEAKRDAAAVPTTVLQQLATAPRCIAPPAKSAGRCGEQAPAAQPGRAARLFNLVTRRFGTRGPDSDSPSPEPEDFSGDRFRAFLASDADAMEVDKTPVSVLHTILRTIVDEIPQRQFLTDHLFRSWREPNVSELLRGSPFSFDYSGSSAPMPRVEYFDACQDAHTHAKFRFGPNAPEDVALLAAAAQNAVNRVIPGDEHAEKVGRCAQFLLSSLPVEDAKLLDWSDLKTVRVVVQKHCTYFPDMQLPDNAVELLLDVLRQARAETLQLSKNQESCRRAVRRQRELEERREEFDKAYARQTTKIAAAEAVIAAERHATKQVSPWVKALEAKKKTLNRQQQRRAKEFGFAHVSAVARQVIRTLFEEVSKAEADTFPKKDEKEAGAAVLVAAKVVLAEKVEALVQDAVHSLLNMGTFGGQDFLALFEKIAAGEASYASGYRHLYVLLVADPRGEFFRRTSIELKRTEKTDEEKEQAVKSVALPSPFSLVPLLKKSDLKTVGIDKFAVDRSLSAQMQRKAVRSGVFVLDTGLGPEALKALNATGTSDKDPVPERVLLQYREYSVLFRRTASEAACGAVIYARAAEDSWVGDVLQGWERVEVLAAQS